MLIDNVSWRQWRLWHWVNMSVTLLMDHGHCKKHKHKNINYKQFIIMKISKLHMACFDAKTKEKDGKWVYGQWSCAHFTIFTIVSIFSLIHTMKIALYSDMDMVLSFSSNCFIPWPPISDCDIGDVRRVADTDQLSNR